MKITVGKKLSAGAVAGLTLLVILAIVAHSSLSKISKSSDVIVSLVPKVEKIDQLQFTLVEALKINDFFVSGDIEKRSSFELSSMAADEAIEGVREIELDSEEKAIFEKMREEFGLLKEKSQIIFETVNASGEGFLSPAINKLVDDVDAVALSLVENSEHLHELLHRKLALAIQKGERAKQLGIRTTATISIAGVLLAAVGSYVLTRNITNPIRALTSAARVITEGDLSKRVNIKSPDEIGELAGAFDSMAARLEDFYNHLEEKVAKRTIELQEEIAERKLADEKIHQQNEFLNNVLESLTHPFYVINADDYTIKIANRASNFDGSYKNLTCYALTHKRSEPCDGDNDPCPVEKIKETKKPLVVEHTHYDKDNNARNVEIHGYPILDSRGNVTQVIEYSLDITDRKRAEQALQNLNEELELTVSQLSRSNQELQSFVYVASHDLREPLRKISAFGQMLTASLENKLNEDEEENLSFMVDGANRMQQMIEALLTYSRVTTKSSNFKPVNLNAVVEELKMLELAFGIEETGANVLIPEPLHSVMADPAQLRQLLQNLIANALKYQKEDAIPEVIISSRVVDNAKVRVEVQDNGIGIKEEYFNNIFTMFKRLHAKSEYEGAGIGLAVCRKIVERHGGTIGVSSTYGHGSTFWFTMPALETPATEAGITASLTA